VFRRGKLIIIKYENDADLYLYRVVRRETQSRIVAHRPPPGPGLLSLTSSQHRPRPRSPQISLCLPHGSKLSLRLTKSEPETKHGLQRHTLPLEHCGVAAPLP